MLYISQHPKHQIIYTFQARWVLRTVNLDIIKAVDFSVRFCIILGLTSACSCVWIWCKIRNGMLHLCLQTLPTAIIVLHSFEMCHSHTLATRPHALILHRCRILDNSFPKYINKWKSVIMWYPATDAFSMLQLAELPITANESGI